MAFAFLFFAPPMLATIPVTALICRYRTFRSRRVSYGTVLAAACIIPLLMFLLFIAAFRDSAKSPPPLLLLELCWFVACMCAFPSFVVVGWYQKQYKENDTHEA